MPPGRRDGLEARGDVDAVAEDLRAGADDVAQVDADADADRVARRPGGRGELGLDRDRRAHRVDRAVEERDEAVADEHVERAAVARHDGA